MAAKKGLFFWIAIIAAVSVALLLVVKFLFPHLVTEFVGMVVGACAVAGGMFLRKKR